MAAATVNGPIVTVSDKRITWSDTGSPADDEAVFKAAKIGTRWGMLFAATDVRPMSFIRWEIANRLLPYKPDEDAPTVRQACEEAYRSVFANYFFAERLSRYGFKSMDDFKENGLRVFGPNLLAKFSKQIDSYTLGIDLLVFGFTPGPPFGDFHIFEVNNPGVANDCNMFGYGIIGSGHDQALTTLLRKPFKAPTVSNAIWRLCDAKFSAETSNGVGKETNVMIAFEDGKLGMLAAACLKDIRAAWEKDRRAGPSLDMSDAIWGGLAQLFPGAQKGSI
jgi:hypothetical protein